MDLKKIIIIAIVAVALVVGAIAALFFGLFGLVILGSTTSGQDSDFIGKACFQELLKSPACYTSEGKFDPEKIFQADEAPLACINYDKTAKGKITQTGGVCNNQWDCADLPNHLMPSSTKTYLSDPKVC